MKLKGKVALVTGAGRGIGKSVALALAGEGASVVLAARTPAELESVRREAEARGVRAVAVPTDLTDDRQVESLFRTVDREFGQLDVLVNNAGIGWFGPVRDMSLEDLDAMWKLNVRGVVKCSQEALARMEERKSGMIVQISSLAGKNAFVGGSGYAATKWAVMGFSRCLMLEAREQNIRVVIVCPGSVDTSFSAEPKTPGRTEKILSPDDVANAVVTAVTLPPRAMMSEIDLRPTNPK
jgi:3-oxoacyl-[acyl-carrier protein] reductase